MERPEEAVQGPVAHGGAGCLIHRHLHALRGFRHRIVRNVPAGAGQAFGRVDVEKIRGGTGTLLEPEHPKGLAENARRRTAGAIEAGALSW